MTTFSDILQQKRQVEMRCLDCTRCSTLVTADLISAFRKKHRSEAVYEMPVEKISQQMVCGNPLCRSKNVVSQRAPRTRTPFAKGYEYPDCALAVHIKIRYSDLASHLIQ